jgi:hypothetical protein
MIPLYHAANPQFGGLSFLDLAELNREEERKNRKETQKWSDEQFKIYQLLKITEAFESDLRRKLLTRQKNNNIVDV